MPNVTLTLDQPILDAAKEHAASECRSLSQQVAFLIKKDTNRRASKPQPRRQRMERKAP